MIPFTPILAIVHLACHAGFDRDGVARTLESAMLVNLLFWGILFPGMLGLMAVLLTYSALIVMGWDDPGRE
jgi:hypothetical protein